MYHSIMMWRKNLFEVKGNFAELTKGMYIYLIARILRIYVVPNQEEQQLELSKQSDEES